jgi:hypothetical protein
MLTAYTLDRRDRIIAVSPEWDQFALDNDGRAACQDQVVGRRLMDAITGDPVRMFMTALLLRVRASGQVEAVPYRCDSPTTKRRYVMLLEPLTEGTVLVSHHLENEELTGLLIRVRTADYGQRAHQRCSICCRIKEAGLWVDPFAVGVNLDLWVIHTICEDCKQAPPQRYRGRQRREIPDTLVASVS